MEKITNYHEKRWVDGFGAPMSDNDLVQRARLSVALGSYDVGSPLAACVRRIDELEAMLVKNEPVNAIASAKVIAAQMDDEGIARAQLARTVQILG